MQELERQLAAKEASLPKEPQADEENAITLLVRMPDGTRRGRRFLKSDKLQVSFPEYPFFFHFPFAFTQIILYLTNRAVAVLQSLFDFIDIARVVKPKTYRLVKTGLKMFC